MIPELQSLSDEIAKMHANSHFDSTKQYYFHVRRKMNMHLDQNAFDKFMHTDKPRLDLLLERFDLDITPYSEKIEYFEVYLKEQDKIGW